MYGLLGAVGFLLGLGLALAFCPRFGLDRDDCCYIYIWGGVSAMAGAKLLFLLTVLPSFLSDLPLLTADPGLFADRYLNSGFVFYGGLIGAVAGAALSSRFFHARLADFLPVLVPVFPLIHAIGRIGCFFAGCCYGRPAPWGIAFTISNVAPNGVKLIPVQLMECAAELVICAVLVRFAARRGENAKLLGLYFLLYAPVRFLLEFLRGDLARGVLWQISTSQWISLLVFSAGAFLFFCKPRQSSTSSD